MILPSNSVNCNYCIKCKFMVRCLFVIITMSKVTAQWSKVSCHSCFREQGDLHISHALSVNEYDIRIICLLVSLHLLVFLIKSCKDLNIIAYIISNCIMKLYVLPTKLVYCVNTHDWKKTSIWGGGHLESQTRKVVNKSMHQSWTMKPDFSLKKTNSSVKATMGLW